MVDKGFTNSTALDQPTNPLSPMRVYLHHLYFSLNRQSRRKKLLVSVSCKVNEKWRI